MKNTNSIKLDDKKGLNQSMNPGNISKNNSILNDTARNIMLRAKKLDLEFSLFTYKVGAFLFNSVTTGKKYLPKETEPLQFEIPDLEKEIYKNLFESVKKSKETGNEVSIRRMKEYMQPYYHISKDMTTNLEINKPKRNVLIRMKEMFDDFTLDSSVIYITGPGCKSGAVLIESKDFGEEELTLKDISAEWEKRTSKQKHLLIIVDANYSGIWARDVATLKEKDLSVLASCKEKEKCFSSKIGSIFVHNFLKLLNKSKAENMLLVDSSPMFGGDYLNTKKFTNFYVNYKDWNSMVPIQKSDFMEISYENGRYVGYINNAQKNFWGIFVWTNGLFKDCKYTGEFIQGQLHGKGGMYYKSGRTYEGDFHENASEGYGEEKYENGDFYKGKYRKGFKSGDGVYTYNNGDVFKGEFIENKPNGKGTLTMKNGSVYVGQFRAGKCNGKGIFKYKNGDIYDGDWANSLKHGNGKYSYSNGDVYEGQFVNGVRHGHGILTKKTGEIYNGEWELDAMSGAGEYKTEHSKTIGEWVKGNITKQPSFFQKIGTKQISARLV